MNPVGEGRSSREEWLSSSSQEPNGGLKVGGLHKRVCGHFYFLSELESLILFLDHNSQD